MKRIAIIAGICILAIVAPCASAWSQDEDNSLSSSMSTAEEGTEEMQEMDREMDVQPGDAIDSEGTGAH